MWVSIGVRQGTKRNYDLRVQQYFKRRVSRWLGQRSRLKYKEDVTQILLFRTTTNTNQSISARAGSSIHPPIHPPLIYLQISLPYLRDEVRPGCLIQLFDDLLEEVVPERILHHLAQVGLGLAADLGRERRVSLVKLELEHPAPDLVNLMN